MYLRQVDLDGKPFSSVEVKEQRSVLKIIRSDGKMASLLYILRSHHYRVGWGLQGGAEKYCTPLL